MSPSGPGDFLLIENKCLPRLKTLSSKYFFIFYEPNELFFFSEPRPLAQPAPTCISLRMNPCRLVLLVKERVDHSIPRKVYQCILY